jgi:hypothetical protein
MLIDVVIQGERNLIKQKAEEILKYKNLTTVIQRTWNVKPKVIPIKIVAPGTIEI